MMRDITSDREKLEKAKAKIKPDDCPELQWRVINYQYEMLDKRENNLRQSTIGNIQQDNNALNAKLAVQYDYEGIMQASIYETQWQICRTQKKLDIATGSNRVSKQEKLDCLKKQLVTQTETLKQLLQAGAKYANEPGRKTAEQAAIYLRNMTACN